MVNGFVDADGSVSTSCTLGLLPFGTGGDFRRTVRVSKDVQTAAQMIAAGQTKRIDLGFLEYTTGEGETESRAFINIASFGLSGKVDEVVNQSSKRFGGKLSFMLATAKAGLSYSAQPVGLTFDDDKEPIEMLISTVAISNGRFFGGGMRMAPEAELDDGFFDVVAVGDMGVADFLFRGHRLYRGTHLTIGQGQLATRQASTRRTSWR